MKLALFFTNNVSLKSWEKTGNLDREVKLYKKLLDYFEKIYFFTYGKNEPELKGIKVLPAAIFNKEFKNIDIFKTNQLNGSWKAVMAKNLYGKKLVVRQGYQWSIFARNKKVPKWKIFLIDLIEKISYRNADAIIISSKADRQYVINRYNLNPEKVYYIPNYIDTNLFKPIEIEKENRICTVAKLEDQKNLFNLIKAVSDLNEKLVIFGSGSLKKKLENFANKLKVDIEFRGNIPNQKLPEEINKSKLFILTSLYEGCPKALLEAMACGLPVIGTNVDGIKEVIKHKENGYLCETSADSIKKAIIEVLNNKKLQEKISQNTRKTILENFSLDKMIEKEIKIYNIIKDDI